MSDPAVNDDLLKVWEIDDKLLNAFQSGAIDLLDAQWLIRFARCQQASGTTRITRMPRRQDLPDDAFVSFLRLLETTPVKFGKSLSIICLSYMWLDPSHPDPDGFTLELLVSVLETLLEPSAPWGIFWDFGSLFQHQDPSRGLYRSAEETKLFRQGLNALPLLYGHPHTRVLKITQFPDQIAFSPSSLSTHNATPYDCRGWPFVESCWAGLTKSSEHVLDLGAWNPKEYATEDNEGLLLAKLLNQLRRSTRPAPLLPEDFDRVLRLRIHLTALMLGRKFEVWQHEFESS